MPWRALYCRSGMELSAGAELASLGVKTFCPYERFKRHKSVRGTTQIRWINTPVFSNYLFINTDNLFEVQTIRGVLKLVSIGAKPLVIPDKVIWAMQALAAPDGLIRTEDMTKNSFRFKGKEGDLFTFKSKGPLAGLIGKIASLASLDKTGEVLAWVELLGRTTEVKLNFSEVGKIISEGEAQAA
jgi:transcription antitermination factor NusG